MALTRNQKIGIAATAGAVLLLVGGAAAANDGGGGDNDGGGDDDNAPPQCPTGFVPQLQSDGTWTCVKIQVVDPPHVDPPPPKPGPGHACNYSGCGQAFDKNHQSPTFYMLKIQQLGYPINAAGSIISEAAMVEIRKFQRDSNEVHDADLFAAIADAPELDEDGLVGNHTIAAIENAHKAVLQLNVPWLGPQGIVHIAKQANS